MAKIGRGGYRTIIIEEWVESGLDGDEFYCRDCTESDDTMLTDAPEDEIGAEETLDSYRTLCGECAWGRGLISNKEMQGLVK